MTLQFACQPFTTVDNVVDASCGCNIDAEEDADLIEILIDEASDILALATGLVVTGRCTATVRPVALCGGNVYDSMYPDRDWRRQFGGINSIPLRGPATDVLEVRIDGVTLSPTEYGLMDDRYLFRRSGCWPSTNDLRLEATEVGTFEIRFAFGRVDKLGEMAATELTCELLRDVKGLSTSLPRGVTSASIQGAQITVRDRAQALRDGDEQIPVVSRFLSIYAPDGMNMVSGVWSPELEQFWNLVQVEGPSGS